ncbi:SPL family radical SAM protein [Alicyclobacillus fastidiosus]|uniref:Radical SAM protein n=1 Tax=Alicyclobacillus fastidiosus TaxID=392011 RepID=A0ABV5AG63_9BACL|nr:radical SAM protein [Alicyclobacillus fastidiosus]WEH11642.1 radical SAM protein [Alicyclobacillus fastidiosus]
MTVKDTNPRRLLTKANGYLGAYDYTLNPYVGCVYACNYCYVRALPVARFHEGDWGSYVDVKHIDEASFRRELQLARQRGSVNIFMSSSTDPYQPTEARVHRTRKLLLAMGAEQASLDFLFIQTRSPLVTNDAALIGSLGDKALVSITVETDLEDVRRRFAPYAPPIEVRLRALKTLREHGVRTQVAVAPLLPSSDQFADKLREATEDVVIDDYFLGDGAHGRRSSALHVADLYRPSELKQWYHQEAIDELQRQFAERFGHSHVFLSQDGFLPPKLRWGAGHA